MKSIAERIADGVESYFGTAGVLHILVSKVIVDAFELFAVRAVRPAVGGSDCRCSLRTAEGVRV